MNTFGFIGFGLIAGSIAKAIRSTRPDSCIIACTRTRSSLDKALEENIVDIAVEKIDTHFSSCDVIFLCSPVKSILSNMEDLSPYVNDSCIITDVGSVKKYIQYGADRLGLSKNFIGGHPMAGSEKSGYMYSSTNLLKGRVYILTPGADVSQDKIDSLSALVRSFSCDLYITDPESHDRAVAGISHLPHLAAAGLASTVKEADTDDLHLMKAFASTGFLDTTRLAASNPEIWSQICSANSEAIISMLSNYIKKLDSVLDSLKAHDDKSIEKLFTESGEYRKGFS